MKTFSLIIFSFSLFVFRLNGQTPFDETATIVDLPNGIFFQQGPGINNTLNWKYPYSTKLTINGGIARNFELSSIGKENVSYVIRQFSQTKNAWTTWKKLILDDGNGNIGIGTESPSNKLDVEGKIDGTVAIEVTNTSSGNNARRGIIVGDGISGHSAFLFSTSSNYNAVPSWKNSGVLGTESKLSNGLVIRSSSGSIRFQPSGISDKIVFNSDGNVGIGTDNPDSKLEIVNKGEGAELLKLTTERPWVFKQTSTGSTTQLDLHSTVSNKDFKITSLNDNRVAQFHVSDNGVSNKIYLVPDGGKVGIGTDNPKAKLSVEGTILTTEIKVLSDISQYPDFVFDDDYELKSIEEVEKYIKENGHLSEIPDQETVEKNGVNLGEMNAKLLQKIEELTLYTIEQNKQLKQQSNVIEELRQMMELQNKKIAKLEKTSR